jgi:hypothetical protein
MRWHCLSRGATYEERVLPLRHLRLAPQLARRLRTAALGEDCYDETYTILVMRHWPKSLTEEAVHDWWPCCRPCHGCFMPHDEHETTKARVGNSLPHSTALTWMRCPYGCRTPTCSSWGNCSSGIRV